jgi:prepilin peptidase CpaA
MFSIESAIFIAWALAVVVFDCRRRLIPNTPVAAGALCALTFADGRTGPFHVSAGTALIGVTSGGIALHALKVRA